MATQLKVENFFDTVLSNLSIPWSGDITLTLGQIPSYSRGIVIISPDNPSQREVCYFHNAVGNTIYITGTNRINPKTHAKNEVVRMNDVAEYFNYLSNNTSQAFYIERTSDTTINVFGGDIMMNSIQYTLSDTVINLTIDGTYYIWFDVWTQLIAMYSSQVPQLVTRAVLTKLWNNFLISYKKYDMTVLNGLVDGVIPSSVQAMIDASINTALWAIVIPPTFNNTFSYWSDGRISQIIDWISSEIYQFDWSQYKWNAKKIFIQRIWDPKKWTATYSLNNLVSITYL